MPLIDKIKSIKQPNKPNGPVWAGPESDKPNGGVTYSLLSRYLGCKERFRIHTIEGLRPREGFNPKIEFGNMFHACEESMLDDTLPWQNALLRYAQDLVKKYRTDQAQIDHWYNICKALFPVYLEHWSKHPESKTRIPLLRETVFNVPYKLPSGRTVYLRGKWDGVDLQGNGVWNVENKTKSSIDADKINRQLKFDLQTLLYLIALNEKPSCDIPRQGYYRHGGGTQKGNTVTSGGANAGEYRIMGVKYNVVRRSAHKSVESMLKKVDDDTKAGRINEWFARWDVEVNQQDYETFKNQCLNPVLENLCDDYEWWSLIAEAPKGKGNAFGYGRHLAFPHHTPRHYRLPYGVYSPVHEGGFGDVDEYIATGSTVGLEVVSNLFPELTT